MCVSLRSSSQGGTKPDTKENARPGRAWLKNLTRAVRGPAHGSWDALRPQDDQLAVLTQLGGLAIGDGAGGLAYEWRDPGICAVCNFEDALDALDGKD